MRLSEVDSTNRLVKDWGRCAPEDGLVVVADHQTSGRGRLGKRWESPRGEGLYFSLLIAPVEVSEAALIPLMAGVVAHDTLAESYPLLKRFLDLKWPNDLLLNGRKVAGVLTESEKSVEGVSFVVLGVGVNCNQSLFPQEISGAGSLRLELGRPVDRNTMLEVFLSHWHRYRRTLANAGGPVAPGPSARQAPGAWPATNDIVDDWKERSRFWQRQKVRFSTGEIVVSGVTRDVAPSGALVVELASGERKEILAGEIEWVRRTTP